MATTDGIQAFVDTAVPNASNDNNDDQQSDVIRQYLSKKVY
jgi:hypothetical protein